MKRSLINAKIREALEFCRRQNFHLPKWATWSPADWAAAGHEADEVRECQLGWDVTDFGKGDYDRLGLAIFTIRNGRPGAADKSDPTAKDYCEKLLLVGEEQITPRHFHWTKMEDIINRAGGKLVIQLWNAEAKTEQLDEQNEVTVSVDGIKQTVPAGGKIVLEPGDSITLPPYCYHLFYAAAGGGMVLCGEVSRVNDDENDNRFLPELPRFPSIEEDEKPLHLLCNEYPPAAG